MGRWVTRTSVAAFQRAKARRITENAVNPTAGTDSGLAQTARVDVGPLDNCARSEVPATVEAGATSTGKKFEAMVAGMLVSDPKMNGNGSMLSAVVVGRHDSAGVTA